MTIYIPMVYRGAIACVFRITRILSEHCLIKEILYDENIKKFLSQKNILAYILKYCVKEYSDMEIQDIIPCIEGEPEISKIKVDASLTHMNDFYDVKSIDGMTTEDTSKEEGIVFFDIRF